MKGSERLSRLLAKESSSPISEQSHPWGPIQNKGTMDDSFGVAFLSSSIEMNYGQIWIWKENSKSAAKLQNIFLALHLLRATLGTGFKDKCD